MARPLRIEYEGAVYHVTARGNERKKIFFTKTDYGKFLTYLKEAKKKYNIDLHCYALMSNHYHLIIETSEANLGRAMHYINGSYTTYINIKRNRSGHLFQGRYRSILVDTDNYLLELSRYIHLNPCRASVVEKPEDYQYSSYLSYIKNREDVVLTKELLLGLLSCRNGNSRDEYRLFIESAIGRELDNPLENVYGGIILGGTGFVKEVLGRIKDEFYRKEDIANRTELRASLEIEDVLEAVSGYYKVSREDIMENKYSEERKVAIYLMKERTGATHREIGEVFLGLSNSAIGKVYQRFRKEIHRDRKLRRRVTTIEKTLSFVGG